jgi:hypothetical protein
VVGAILPFPCKNPHALLLDLMTQGGSSGSPVFESESGNVVGILYGGIEEQRILDGGKDGVMIYKNPTGISYAVPSHFIAGLIKELPNQEGWQDVDVSKMRSLEDLIREGLEQYKRGDLGRDVIEIDQSQIIIPRVKV